jgi:NAD(P)-dependent dehydrogenase (short-subunit alcohol dehydrogenase family)
MSPIEGKVVIVTGAGGGIGSATARLLAERGAKVVLAERQLATAERVSGAMPWRFRRTPSPARSRSRSSSSLRSTSTRS